MLDWLDDAMRLFPLVLLWKTYAMALWHTMRRPVKESFVPCRNVKRCRRKHRLAMVFKKGKPGIFVLVH